MLNGVTIAADYEDQNEGTGQGATAHRLNNALGLAPRQFIEWLGLEPCVLPDGRVKGEQDVCLGWPEYNVFDARTTTAAGAALAGLTCSALNDVGFTFPQIADLIDYFGVEKAV